MAVEKIEGVEKVEADSAKGTATVTMKPGVELNKDQIETVLKGSKYGVTDVKEKT